MDGILIVDKPRGMTSHDVVDFIRRRFRIKKVGHAGTLDPLATGVLVVLVGRATKLSSILMSDDKEYEVVMTLGRRTDTGDADGKVIYEHPGCGGITREMIEASLKKFTGEIMQVPPMMSAIKHKGKKLYELARQGIEVERPSRQIHVKELALLDYAPPDAMLRIRCSKGTYVRVLCDDVGLLLGCGAYVSNIRRTCSGDFRIKDAINFDKVRSLKKDELRYALKNESYYKFKAS
jgi:tRNA pseudouridine55 synthase